MGIFLRQTIDLKKLNTKDADRAFALASQYIEKVDLMSPCYEYEDNGFYVVEKAKLTRLPYGESKEVEGYRIIGDYGSKRIIEHFDIYKDVCNYFSNNAMTLFEKLDNKSYSEREQIIKAENLDDNNFLMEIWDSKTQGERAHIHLIAIGLIYEGITNKAFTIHGDITGSQIDSAIEQLKDVVGYEAGYPSRYSADEEESCNMVAGLLAMFGAANPMQTLDVDYTEDIVGIENLWKYGLGPNLHEYWRDVFGAIYLLLESNREVYNDKSKADVLSKLQTMSRVNNITWSKESLEYVMGHDDENFIKDICTLSCLTDVSHMSEHTEGASGSNDKSELEYKLNSLKPFFKEIFKQKNLIELFEADKNDALFKD